MEHEYIQNYKALQNAFKKVNIEKVKLNNNTNKVDKKKWNYIFKLKKNNYHLFFVNYFGVFYFKLLFLFFFNTNIF